jgi:hypothetical protein
LPKIAPPVQLVSVNVAEKAPEHSVHQLGGAGWGLRLDTVPA